MHQIQFYLIGRKPTLSLFQQLISNLDLLFHFIECLLLHLQLQLRLVRLILYIQPIHNLNMLLHLQLKHFNRRREDGFSFPIFREQLSLHVQIGLGLLQIVKLHLKALHSLFSLFNFLTLPITNC